MVASFFCLYNNFHQILRKRMGLYQNDSFDTTPLRYVRICKMQGAEGEGAGSLLTLMTEPES